MQEKKKRYLTNIKQFKLLSIIDDLKYRSISVNRFSTKGNCISAAKAPYNTKEKRIAVYSCIVLIISCLLIKKCQKIRLGKK